MEGVSLQVVLIELFGVELSKYLLATSQTPSMTIYKLFFPIIRFLLVLYYIL
jgi:hypothetical protein